MPVSQFTSTLLLWDAKSGLDRGFPRTMNVSVGFSMEHFAENAKLFDCSQNYWLALAPSYLAFADVGFKKRLPAQVLSAASRFFVPTAEMTTEPSKFPKSMLEAEPALLASLPVFGARIIFQPSNRNIIREYLADSLVSDFLDFGQSFQINMDPFWGDNVPLFVTHSLPVKVSGLRIGLDSMQDGQVNLFFSRNEDLFDRAVMVCEVQSNNSRKVTNGVEFVHIFLVLKRHGTKHDRCRRTSLIITVAELAKKVLSTSVLNITVRTYISSAEFHLHGHNGRDRSSRPGVTGAYEIAEADGILRLATEFWCYEKCKSHAGGAMSEAIAPQRLRNRYGQLVDPSHLGYRLHHLLLHVNLIIIAKQCLARRGATESIRDGRVP
ncbi:hypothetical protein B0J12DRAFT_763770 [Macrophomina phaseolina]|uniref:Inorganic diphosphatase n=1 Tax=Macrophomina phaseolina TaxID=35725 RepID=A0ABQ8GQM1_9PEZI|nr:hypothetical protein B0J12DRAFT_763770 [Macrophomina phaseolina]